MKDAWRRGQDLTVEGWIYRMTDGSYRNLNVSVEHPENLDDLRLKTINQRQKIGVGR